MRLSARIVGFMLVGSLLAFSAPVRAQVCGDGNVDPGETCDPPNLAPNPVSGQVECRIDCTSCGDGVVQSNASETCDIGPFRSCGGCLSSCYERIYLRPGCPCALDDPGLADIRAEILAACDCGNASSKGAFRRCARAQLALVSPRSSRYRLPRQGDQLLGALGLRQAGGGHVLSDERPRDQAMRHQARCRPLHRARGWIRVARRERELLRRVPVKG